MSRFLTYRVRLVLWSVGLWVAVASTVALLVGFYASQSGWIDPTSVRGGRLLVAWFGSLMVPGLIAAIATAWFVAKAASRPIHELRRALRDLRPESLDEGSTDFPTPDFGLPQVRAELVKTRQRMADALNAQERFIANVSHEFRTPIAVLLTETDVLLQTHRDLPDEASAYADSVRQEMLRLKQMVDGFLLLIQIEHGKRRPPRKRVYVFDELLEAVSSLQGFAEPYGVKLDVRLDPDSDLDAFTVLGDTTLFRQMVSNLLRNAVRFSPRNETVEVSAELGQPEKGFKHGTVIVRVRDRGPGVPEQVVEHLFDRFVQSPAEHRRGRGTGLGLEISQSVAELHRGIVSVRNKPEGGCEFTVKVPKFASAET